MSSILCDDVASLHLAKQLLRDEVEIVLPDRPLVSAVVDVVDVGDLLLVEKLVQRLRWPGREIVFIAARDPEQAELAKCAGFGDQSVERSAAAGSPRKSGDPGELIEMLQTNSHRLPGSHRQPGQRTVLAIGFD